MDIFDASSACLAAEPWPALRTLKEVQIRVDWDAIDGCAPVAFPVLRCLPGSTDGFMAFSSVADVARFVKGGLGEVTDVVMKVTWEQRRGGAPGDRRLKISVIAPGLGDDGAVGTLACPPTPAEEAWATLVLACLPKLGQMVGIAAGNNDADSDIWAPTVNDELTLQESLTVRAGDLRCNVNGSITLTAVPASSGKEGAGAGRAARGQKRGGGVTVVPFSARSASGEGSDPSSGTSINRIAPNTRLRRCRGCGKDVTAANVGVSSSAVATAHLTGIPCRCAGVYYCSTRCQANDWRNGHDKECSEFLKSWDGLTQLISPGPFLFLDDVTTHILSGATCICEVLSCWGFHSGGSPWRHVPGCVCFDIQAFSTARSSSGLKAIGTLPHSRSSLSLSLFSPCASWVDLYRLCRLPLAAPDAIVYTHSATLYHIIRLLALRNQLSCQASDGSARDAADEPSVSPDDVMLVDCVQPPRGLLDYPHQLTLLQLLLGNLSLHVRIVGANVPKDASGKVLEWAPPAVSGGRNASTATNLVGRDPRVVPRIPKRVPPGTLFVSFHLVDDLSSLLMASLEDGGVLPDVVVALDAELATAPHWEALLSSLSVFVNEGLPFFVTERSLFAANQAAAALTSVECEKPMQPVLNPFRAPVVCPAVVDDDTVALAAVPNAYLLGFGVDPWTADTDPVDEDDGAADGKDSDDAREVDDELDVTADASVDDDDASADEAVDASSDN